jgi:hypothetical protein
MARTMREMLDCEQCAEFARELASIGQHVGAFERAELADAVPSGSTRSRVRLTVACVIARYTTAVLCFVRAMRPRSNRGHRRVVSGGDYM